MQQHPLVFPWVAQKRANPFSVSIFSLSVSTVNVRTQGAATPATSKGLSVAQKRTRRTRRTQKGNAWFRKYDDCWYATINGKRQKLLGIQGDPIKGQGNKEEAEKALARVKLGMAPDPTPKEKPSVAHVLNFFLEEIQRTESPAYHSNAKRCLDDLNAFCGALPATDIRKRHVLRWIDKHDGWKSDNTLRTVVGTVKAAFNRAVNDEDFPLDANPLSALKKPKGFGRITAFEHSDVEEILDYCNRPPGYKAVSLAPIGDFFQALLETGARPSELASVTANDVEQTERGLRLVLKAQDDQGNHRHKTAKKTGKTRRIFLNDKAEFIIRRLMLKHPTGPLFRTPRGKPWTKVNWVHTFCNIKKKLSWNDDPRKEELSFYSCRHTFAKRVLCGYFGVKGDLYTVAGLLGNTVKVCEDHYAQWCDSYNAPLWEAIGRTTKRMVG